MANIQLSFAINLYEHVRDLLDGTVRAEGIDFTFLRMPTEELFYRFVRYREWDVSEMAFGKLIVLISQEDRSIVAIPVFVSRSFRHSSIYVRSDAGITRPEHLAGKRIGVPTWSQSACSSPIGDATAQSASVRAASASTSPSSGSIVASLPPAQTLVPWGEACPAAMRPRRGTSPCAAENGFHEEAAGQTWTSNSRSAWLSETFRSVEAERRPTMSAHGIW